MITTGQKTDPLSASNYQLHTPSFFWPSHAPRTCILAFAISSNSMHDTSRLLSVFWTTWSGLRQVFWAQSFCRFAFRQRSSIEGLRLLHFGPRGLGVRCCFWLYLGGRPL